MVNTKSRRALGRGLSNLIPVSAPEKNDENEIVFIDSHTIKPNPFQPRKEFDAKEIESLAESIKNQGLLQPILVRNTTGDNYEIISGERRFRAFQLLGEIKIPCIIKNMVSDRSMLELAIVENVQRENLNDIEKAYAFQRLIQECELSHDELSKRMGISRTVVTNTLRLLKLSKNIQTMIQKKELTMGHARALLTLDNNKKIEELANKIIHDQLSVRDVEKITQTQKNKTARLKKKKKDYSSDDIHINDLKEKLQYHFGTTINIISKSNNKGKIEIAYYTMEDLNRIITLIMNRKK